MDITTQRLLMGSSASGETYWIVSQIFDGGTQTGDFRRTGNSLDFDSNDNLILLSSAGYDNYGSGDPTYLYSMSQEGIVNWAKRLSYDGGAYYAPKIQYPRIILSPDKTKIFHRSDVNRISDNDRGSYFSSINTSNGSFNFKKYLYAQNGGNTVGIAVNSSGNIVSGLNPYQMAVWPSTGGNPTARINHWRLSGTSVSWGAGDSFEYRVFDSNNNDLYVCGQYFRPSDSNTAGFFVHASASSLSPYACGEIYSSGSYSTNASSIKFNPVDNKIAVSGKHNNYPMIVYFNTSGVSWSYYGDGLNHSNRSTYVDVDAAGNIYWCFRVNTTLIYILKFNSSGTVLWQRVIDTPRALSGFHVHKEGMYILSENLVIKLPLDGTMTGTYTDSSISVTYSSTSVSLVSGTVTYTAKTPSTVSSGENYSTVSITNSELTPNLVVNQLEIT